MIMFSSDYNGDGDDQSKGCHDGTWDVVEDCEIFKTMNIQNIKESKIFSCCVRDKIFV